MDKLTPSQWIAQCAERLHDRWQTVEPAVLEEIAVDLWRDSHLRQMPPKDAAVLWLKPLEVGER